MSDARRAGAPQEERRPAGAPNEAPRPAGAPSDGDGDVSEASAAAGSAAKEVARDLDELLSETQRERDEYLALAQRARADFENYRKRAARDAEEAGRRAKAGLARELIPVVDNLERALRAAGVDPDGGERGAGDTEALDALTQGVALVLRELRDALARAGVEAFDPAGERFDPAWHEALATRPADGVEAGHVAETLERGYRLEDQLLRPARVVVSE
jgi:molecular chaperone GrpE